MKTRLLFLASLLALVLVGVCLWQSRQLRSARLRLAQAQADLFAETEARLEQENRGKALERGQAGLHQQIFDLSAMVGQLRSQQTNIRPSTARTSALTATASSDSSEGGLFGGSAMRDMLAKMMKDPAMKEMLRMQQKVMVNTQYGPLFKDLALSAERKDKLSQLLLDQQMETMERAQDLFGTNGGVDLTKLSAATKENESKAAEGIKALLGDQYPYYEDYKKTMGDRIQLEQLKSQLDGTKTALNDAQVKDLLYVIADEREKNPPVISQDPQAAAANLEKMFSGDTMEKQLQWQEELNRRVLERAGTILSAEQLKSYTDFQTQQLEMQKFGMKMAREMFGKKPATSPPSPPEK
jgi:hypothetical protein